MTRRRRRTVRVRNMRTENENVDSLDAEVDEEPEEPTAEVDEMEVGERPSPRRRRRKVEEVKTERPSPRRRKVEDVKVNEEPAVEMDEEPEPESTSVKMDTVQLFNSMLTRLAEGDVLHIKCVASSEYEVSISSSTTLTSVPEKPVVKVSVDDMLTDEFKEWRKAWAALTYEEKVEAAEEAGVEWDRHENPKVDVMRLSAAMREAEGIEKWKPEYSTRKARAAARGK